MDKKTFSSFIDDIQSDSLNYLTMERAVAFSAFNENIIEKLKGDSRKTDDEIWSEIKDNTISKETVLKLYNRIK